MTTDFAAPVFGIKAKLWTYCRVGHIDFAAPVFGIKAKRARSHLRPEPYFAAPVFGIKAKLTIVRGPVCRNFAAPVFGIKAKRNGGQFDGLDNLNFHIFPFSPSIKLTAVLIHLDTGGKLAENAVFRQIPAEMNGIFGYQWRTLVSASK